jgi:hypothetical protein
LPQTQNAPNPPPGFIPEQPTGAIAPPPPGFVPEKQPKWAVQAPDGKVIQFPDNFTDVDVTREMNKMYPVQGQGGGGLDSLVADPQFSSLQPSDQRKALAGVSGDDTFSRLSDEDTGRYVKAHQAILSQNTTNNTLSKTSGISAQPKPFTLPWLKQGAWRAGASTADAAPGIGATLGATAGATGGPLSAVGGAGMGAMGGVGLQQIMRRILGYPNVPQTSGEAAQDITRQGTTQAAIQAGTELLPFLAGPLKDAATTQYEKALAPTTKINKAITRDIVPQLIQRGESGSLEGLENRAGQKIADINPQLNTAYGQAQGAGPIAGSGAQVVADLEKLKQSYIDQGVVVQPQAVNAIEGVQSIVRQYGPDMSPNSLRKVRQIFEDPVAQRGAYAGADISTNYALNAQKQAADSIRGILNGNPDIGALNKEISFWLDVQRVASQSGLRRTGQEGGLLKTLWPLGAAMAGGGAGFATHGTEAGIGAAATTMLATQAGMAMRSPAWRTVSSVAKDRLAQALARGDVGQVTALLGRLGLAGATVPPQSPQGGLPWQRQQQPQQ